MGRKQDDVCLGREGELGRLRWENGDVNVANGKEEDGALCNTDSQGKVLVETREGDTAQRIQS